MEETEYLNENRKYRNIKIFGGILGFFLLILSMYRTLSKEPMINDFQLMLTLNTALSIIGIIYRILAGIFLGRMASKGLLPFNSIIWTILGLLFSNLMLIVSALIPFKVYNKEKLNINHKNK